ncbi:unnamed protein product [Mytilus coruscus]|uniref:C-type lectin domain-containing protein n=1 Tax=Mytilus coruscus TaxID=42192 RepID=A0A6J8AGS2_MYTCO|nr:unnamed protein product [Mytilus coruscus]
MHSQNVKEAGCTLEIPATFSVIDISHGWMQRAYHSELASVETGAENDFITDNINRIKNGLSKKRESDGKYYILFPHTRQKYYIFQQTCRESNTYFDITANNNNQQDFNETFEPDFWIGGTDAVVEGVWVWAASGKAITYSNFIGNTPDNSVFVNPDGESCLEIVQWTAGSVGKWNDDNCLDESHFICEMEYV